MKTHTEASQIQYHFLQIGAVQVAYRQIGKGDPVLLVHGFGTSSYTWTYVAEELPSGYRYILLDLKGFGKSDKPQDVTYRLRDQAGILEQVIQTLDLRRVVLVGHSFGGAVVLAYLLDGRGKEDGYVRGLILLDTPGYPQRLPPLVTRLTKPVVSKLGLQLLPARYLVRMTLEEVFFDDTKIPADLVEAYTQALELPGAKNALLVTAKYLTQEESPALGQQCAMLTFPTLIIWGEKDEIVPLENASRFAADLPKCTVKTIANCGHAPQEECPTETAKIMSDFLKRLHQQSEG